MTMGPFFHGYGHTVGNALRRVLLSSLSGAAVIAVNIKGAQHEFDTMENVKEDVLEIILNLKQLRMKVFSDEPVKLTLKAKGEKVVTGKDIAKNSDVEIVNTDLVIANLTDKSAEFEMEITVSKGRGYVPTEKRVGEKPELGTISIDALFSPIRSVGYKVEDMRIGQVTNYDKLTLSVETDGSISAEEAVRQSAQVLLDHFEILMKVGVEESAKKEEAEGSSEDSEDLVPEPESESESDDENETESKEKTKEDDKTEPAADETSKDAEGSDKESEDKE